MVKIAAMLLLMLLLCDYVILTQSLLNIGPAIRKKGGARSQFPLLHNNSTKEIFLNTGGGHCPTTRLLLRVMLEKYCAGTQ